jgi:hypothetical protein
MLFLYGVKGKLWYASEKRRRLLRQQQPTEHCSIRDGANDDCWDDEARHAVLSFEDVLHRLRSNELSVLRLGGKNSNYFDSSDNHHHNHSLVTALERAVRMNVSVRSVCLGWRIPHICLLRILHAITYDGGIPLHQLRHLEIAVLGNDHRQRIPESLLTDLFLRQQKLVSIHLRSIHVDAEPPEHHPSLSTAVSHKSKRYHCGTPHFCPGSVVTRCILQQYQRLNCLKSLALIDCNVTSDIAMELAQFLHIRGGIADLSLRSNRNLSGRGLRVICQAPVVRRLELSLCDLDGSDAISVAEGIASRSWPIEELALAGNYRVDAAGLLALLQPTCCEKMVSLDISYCAVSSDRLIAIFGALELLQPERCLLRRLVLRGSAVANDAVVLALERLLHSNCPLRYLDLTDPQEPKPLSLQQLRQIGDAMEHNYELEELFVDHDEHVPSSAYDAIWKDMHFYLQLNKAGRRILRDPWRGIRNTKSEDDWFDVLERAGKEDNLDVLNWIVRHSGGSRFQRRSSDHTG